MAEKNKKAPKEEKKHLTAAEYFKPHRNALTPEMTALMNDVRAWKEYVRDKRGEELERRDRTGKTARIHKQFKKMFPNVV